MSVEISNQSQHLINFTCQEASLILRALELYERKLKEPHYDMREGTMNFGKLLEPDQASLDCIAIIALKIDSSGPFHMTLKKG